MSWQDRPASPPVLQSKFLPLVPFTSLFLLGTSLVFRFRPLCIASLGYYLFFLFYYERHTPIGDYMTRYSVGCQMIAAFGRLVNGLFLLPAESFTRRRGKHDGNEKTKKFTGWQRFLDTLEVGFLAPRGAGWYVIVPCIHRTNLF